MSEQSGTRDAQPGDDVPTSDILEHLAIVEERVRQRAESDALGAANERLQTTIARNGARSERNATLRFLMMCIMATVGLAAVLYFQIDSQGSGQLRNELIRQCEQRNVNLITWQSSLDQQAAIADADGSADYAATLRQLRNSLQRGDCSALR